jgi:hypothetical protein
LLLWVWLIAEFINAPLIKHNTNKKDDDSTTQSNDSNP